MPPKGTARFTLPGADTMRAEVGATPNNLAQTSNLSSAATKKVLNEEMTQKTTCERVVNGLKKLGHQTASYDMIVEHTS